MKYMDEYRDGAVAKALSEKIRDLSTKRVRLMEICGTHTMAIFRHGIRSLLPETIELVSGPGCPVCVTAMEEIDRAVKLARTKGVIVTTFGDMIRVPGSTASLQTAQAEGAIVKMVYSTFDALKIATQNRDSEVVFLALGLKPPRLRWPPPFRRRKRTEPTTSQYFPPINFCRRPWMPFFPEEMSWWTGLSVRAM